MKSRLLIQIVVVVSVLLLCAGFGVYSFLRLHSVEHRQDFNLYTLVPQDATAVLETDRMADLVSDINELDCSKDNRFLYVSELFVYLKNYLHTLLEDTPHGLSKQMNKVLLSFHAPDGPMNQVLYCSLGAGDYELVGNFVQKYCSSTFPAKYFDYKGEEIRIYPMENGRFLSVYFTRDFLVISFQKRLVEQVIDASRSKKSLMNLASFRTIHSGKHKNVAATLYVRMKEVDMGKPTDGMRSQTRLGGWTEFDMKFNENAIYCSGISHGADSTRTFMNVLRVQEPVEGFPGALLPSSAFFYDRLAISDRKVMFGFTARQEYARATYSDYIKQRDEEWMTFLDDFAGESVTACLFRSQDTLDTAPYAVMAIPVKDEQMAERRLRSLLHTTPAEEGAPPMPKASSVHPRYPKAAKYRKYVLPRNTLLTQMTGITENALYTFACFYQGSLLLAPDVSSLSAYIDAMERDDVLDETPAYEESAVSLSPQYNFVMFADMEVMMSLPETYVRLIPNFFFRHAKFFRHFVLSVQFTCTEGVVYPNIVLLYKG